jgi:2'-5' RNA ligase
MAFRAFVAVPVPPAEALVALADALAAGPADLKVVDPTKHHLTLSFLGDVPDDATPRIAAALDAACAGQPAFALQLHGVGAFPNARRPRVVWAGARPEPRMATLAERVRRALGDAGFAQDDKPFKVHLTLARARAQGGDAKAAAFVQANAERPLPALPVHEVRLYRSTLGRGGSTYDVLHAARLEA